jgi:hypothetical protein
MTDLAARIASEKIGIPGFFLQPENPFLEISGTDPQTIYVTYYVARDENGMLQDRVGFALDPNGEFKHGIKWLANGKKEREYALFITYIFQSPEIQEIECSTLHYSSTYQPTPDAKLQQHMCVPWGRATYAFDVVIKLASQAHVKRVDPIIVVTPQ